jgi:hypothetical protein
VVQKVVQMTAAATTNCRGTLLVDYTDTGMLLLGNRASCHRGEQLRDAQAANRRLEIVEFATAMPDLHPQEPVWKATLKAVHQNHSHRRLPDLAKVFNGYLTNTFRSSFLDRYGWALIARCIEN